MVDLGNIALIFPPMEDFFITSRFIPVE